MTRLWTQMYAMLPTEWEFRGIVAGPREADPHVRKGQWLSWARHSSNHAGYRGHVPSHRPS